MNDNKKKSEYDRISTSSSSSTTTVQVKSYGTGHWLVRNSQTGKFYATKGDNPVPDVRVREIVQPLPNPSVDEETYELAEKAVLEYLNENPE